MSKINCLQPMFKEKTDDKDDTFYQFMITLLIPLIVVTECIWSLAKASLIVNKSKQNWIVGRRPKLVWEWARLTRRERSTVKSIVANNTLDLPRYPYDQTLEPWRALIILYMVVDLIFVGLFNLSIINNNLSIILPFLQLISHVFGTFSFLFIFNPKFAWQNSGKNKRLSDKSRSRLHSFQL